MVKKKKDESEQKQEGDQLSARPIGQSDQPTPAENEHYSKGTWAGFEQFRCTHCEFDTLEFPVMVEHIFWVHSILLEIDPKEDQ